jgi:cyclohexanone monooxygenase
MGRVSPSLRVVTRPSDPESSDRHTAFCRLEQQWIGQHVEWITDCIDNMRKSGRTSIEATPQAQDQWVAHVNDIVNMTLMPGANSWYMSANIPGKPRAFLPYLGPQGVGGYRKKCDDVEARGYEGFILA